MSIASIWRGRKGDDAPATNPDANHLDLFAKTDGQWYSRDSTGTVSPLGVTQAFGDGRWLQRDQGTLVGHATVAGVAGMLYWDTTENVLKFVDNDTSRALSIGHEDWIDAKNVTGSTIGNGVPVYVNGANTASPTIALAKADAQGTSILAGVTTQSIANNATGKVTRFGVIHGMDTSAFTAGADVYLSATTAGALTATAPTGTNFVAKVGTVLTSNASTGQLLVTLDTTLPNASATQRGAMSALDKKKSDNMYYDVTTWDATGVNNLVGDDSTDNASRWSALFTALPVGATVYFPSGTYRTSAEFALSADKHLNITGAGKYASIIKATNTTQSHFRITGAFWYNQFSDLGFAHSGTPTAGAAINIDPGASAAAIGSSIYRCSFLNVFTAVRAVGAQAANLSVWDSLEISSTVVNSRGLLINGSTINLICSNSTINMGYPPFHVAGTAGIEINQSGAVQFTGGEFIGGANTLLMNANQGGSTSIAAVYAVNTFFDQASGSTIKITGSNVVNRCKFVQCGITTGDLAGSIAFEIASAGTGSVGTATAAADGIDIVDCDIYCNGNPAGTINGIQITGAQGVTIIGNRISGNSSRVLTNGIIVTPVNAAAYTKVYISNNKIGITNNFPNGVTNGIVLNAGSNTYGAIDLADNDLTGCTTPVTDNSTLSNANLSYKNINSNLGYGAGQALIPLTSTGAASLPNAGRGVVTAVAGTEIFVTTFRIPANAVAVGDIIQVDLITQATGTGTGTLAPHFRAGTAGTIAGDTIINATGTSAATTLNGWQTTHAYFYVVALGSTATVAATFEGHTLAASFGPTAAAEGPANIVTTSPWFITVGIASNTTLSHTVRNCRARII